MVPMPANSVDPSSEKDTKGKQMSADGTNAKTTGTNKNRLLSLDGWAVLAAFVAALLIRAGVFKHVPW
jgi:hypothetical protein